MDALFSVRIETLGCRLNQVESEALAAEFLRCRFSLFDREKNTLHERVGLCIVNTCTVTGKAEQKARRLIRLLLKEHGGAVILVTGCYAELEAEAIEALDGRTHRVIAFSGKKKDELSRLPAFVCSFFEKGADSAGDSIEALKTCLFAFKTKVAAGGAAGTKTLFKLSSPVFTFHSRAGLKVQDGCNSTCAYCRIRLARGPSVSLPAAEAVDRLREIEKNGAAEAVLSGINLSQYFDKDCGRFPELLSLLLKHTDRIRLRISSLYPDLVTQALVSVLKHERICPHFHLSIQSGSSRILKAMNRAYRPADIAGAVAALRSAKDNPFIGCDIITGFPSEADEDFEQTFSMCERLQFSCIHVFPFSARPGTQAFSMKNKVPERISGKRAARLTALSEKQYAEYMDSCGGKTFFAVAERPVFGKPLTVVTENYLVLPLKSGKKTDNYKGGEGLFVRVCGGFAELADFNDL